jgi:dTDP-4-amino-4,6-dideoxygalactose transaminase
MSTVEQFESAIAEFYGAPYAVATDCCTHAIELSLRLVEANNVICPTNTYISIPFTLIKLGLDWTFSDLQWQHYYQLGNTNIIDAAVYWKENSYISGTFMCLSFQFKKHLNLGKGGAILLDNFTDYVKLKKLCHDGRIPNELWKEQDIDTVGYHYYMPIDTATLGLEKMPEACRTVPKKWSYLDYPYLPNMKVFN